MNQIIRQPLPRASIPPMEENLRHAKRSISGDNTRILKNPIGFSIPAPASILRSQSYGEAEFASTGQRLIGSDGPYEGNPYFRRANEIGPSHRIPGLGHLGGLLVPPGWKAGDEPIDPQAAEALYNTARRAASDALTKSEEEATALSANAQKMRGKEIKERQDTQVQFDHMVLEERVKIYEKHEERKRVAVQGAGLSQPRTPTSVAFSPPRPLQPPTSTSFPDYHGPVRTDAFLHPPRYIDGHGTQAGQQGKLKHE